MYLSKLELHGFKSFAHRTSVQFDPGITAIVGPNGCGKSNIVDAVRWVIGEQRARILRSEKMENVIFNGTSSRRPLGMAEVMLTVQNNRGVLPTEYTEVTLGRRLYRSGESEYLLNGTKCRLQDITDLFMDTGMGAGAYSVIELKMIEEILSENYQDRRRLFEEAAGITKYKLRRKQALSKLDGTQADLTRLRDLTDEIDKQVKTLRRQAEKAARHREYTDRLQLLERSLAQLEYDRLVDYHRTLTTEASSLSQQVETLGKQQTDEEKRAEGLQAELAESEQDLSERRRILASRQDAVRALETELQVILERAAATERDLDRLTREAELDDERRATLNRTLESLRAQQAELTPAVESAAQALADAQRTRDESRQRAEASQAALQQARRDEQEAEQRRAATRSTLDRLTTRIELLDRERAGVTTQIEALAQTAGEIEARARLSKRGLEQAQLDLAQARAAFEQAAEEAKATRAELDTAREQLRKAEQDRAGLAAQANLLGSLVSSLQDFSDSVRFLGTNREWTSGELLSVADVLACDDANRIAMEAALGTYASCIVVRSEEEAAAAVDLLRRRQKGQATFIVLDRLNPDASPAEVPGATPFSRLVRVVDPVYQPLIPALFDGCYLVDSYEEAEAASLTTSTPARIIARSGEWATTSGMRHGGSRQTGVSAVVNRMGRREQLQEVQARLQESENTLKSASIRVKALEETLRAIPVEEYRADVARLERALNDAEKTSARAGYESETLDKRYTELSNRLDSLQTEINKGREEIERLEAEASEAALARETAHAARSDAEQAYQAAEIESRTALSHFNDANVAAVQARNRADNLARDLDNTTRALAELEGRAQNRAGQIELLTGQAGGGEEKRIQIEGRLAKEKESRDALQRELSLAEEQAASLRATLAQIESNLRGVRYQREQSMREENARAVRIAEIQTRTEDLVLSIEEAYGFSLRDERIEVDPEFSETSARAEVQDLRARLKVLGAVNELALEQYEEEKQRLEFLTAQRKDLETAESTLLSTISELNTEAARRFKETYEAVHTNFIRIFEGLFGEGATASLELVDPNDPLESPIEIMARPKGKRPSAITQLSGGEKTLTAIALLFAIYLVKPSPFCILDEVDAPLDEANVERFMQLIRDFAAETQFILVTHNKRTMEAADRMYGVTMQEQGVSQLVGVQFSEVAAD